MTQDDQATPEPIPAKDSGPKVTDVAAWSATEPAPPARRGIAPVLQGFLGGLIGGVIVSLLAVVVVSATLPQLRAYLLAPQESRTDALGRDIDAIKGRLAALEQRLPATTEKGSDEAAAQLQTLDQRLATLEGRLQNPAGDPRLAALADQANRLSADVTRLHGEVDGLRHAMPPEGTILRLAERAEAAEKASRDIAAQRQSAEALLLVVGQLRDAVNRGDPYEAELRAARRVAPPEETPVLDGLAGGAAHGIVRRDVLIAGFPKLADKLVRASVAPPDGDFWQRAVGRLTALVSIRRVDGQGDSAAAIVARTEARVKEGDLAKAVQELSALRDEPARLAEPWVDGASARIAADRSLSELAAAAAAQTAKSGG